MAVPAVLQTGDNRDFGPSTLDVTFPDPQLEGGTNAVYTLHGGGSSVTSIVDDAGNEYAPILSYHSTNPPGMDDGRFEVWGAVGIVASGANVVHITWTDGGNIQAFTAELEASVPGVSAGKSGSGQALASDPFTTTAADSLILAYLAAGSTITVGMGYTQEAMDGFFGTVLASAPAGVPGVYTVTASCENEDSLWDLTFCTWAAPAVSSSNGIWFGTDA